MDFFKNNFWGEPIPKRKIDRIVTENEIHRNKMKVKRIWSGSDI